MVRRWPPGPLGRKRRAVGRLLRHVLGDFDVAGAGLLRLGQLEGLADDLGNHRAHLDPRVPLRQRTQVLDDVDVLMRLLVDPVAAGLAGDGDERCVVEIGVGNTGCQVGRARAEGGQAHARATRQPASESRMSRISSPGRPNTYWTPSFSRHLTIRSDAFTGYAIQTVLMFTN